MGGDLKICEELTECEAAIQGCTPLEEPGRFHDEPESVVPKPGCEERFDLDANGVLDCQAPKAFCDTDDQTTTPCQLDCNVDRIGEGEFSLIDHCDIARIFAAVGTRVQGFAACGDRRDRDQDRLITILDAAACVEQCTFTDCASEPDGGLRA